MTAAFIDQPPLRLAAARAGGINPLMRELGHTRQTFYDWLRDGGAPVVPAVLIARLTGLDPHALVAEQHRETLDLVLDYFARRG